MCLGSFYGKPGSHIFPLLIRCTSHLGPSIVTLLNDKFDCFAPIPRHLLSPPYLSAKLHWPGLLPASSSFPSSCPAVSRVLQPHKCFLQVYSHRSRRLTHITGVSCPPMLTPQASGTDWLVPRHRHHRHPSAPNSSPQWCVLINSPYAI